MRPIHVATVRNQKGRQVARIEAAEKDGNLFLAITAAEGRWRTALDPLNREGSIDLGLDGQLWFIVSRSGQEEATLLAGQIEKRTNGALRLVSEQSAIEQAQFAEMNLAYHSKQEYVPFKDLIKGLESHAE